MVNLTPKTVQRFYRDATQHFGATIVDKKDDAGMKAIGTFLDGIGVLDRDDFMTRFTTTIFTDIYCPFDVGIAGRYSLEAQIDVLVHELVHVQQFKADQVGFTVGYLVQKSSRAEYEAQAYSADLEMWYWRTGELYSIEDRVQQLEHYGLEREHIEFAADYLDSISMTILEGATVNAIAAWAIDWMENQGIKGHG